MNSSIQGFGYYNGDYVTIIGSHKDRLLILSSNNPIESVWILYTELTLVTWYIHSNCA